MDITFSIEAVSIEAAIEAAKPIAASGLATVGGSPAQLVSFHLELAPDRELQHA